MAITVLQYPNMIDNATLMQKLKLDFPERKVQKILFDKGFQVRKNSFTLHNVAVKANAKTGKIKVTGTYDVVWMYVFICFPLFIYVSMKKKSHEAFKASVVERIEHYHNNPDGIF